MKRVVLFAASVVMTLAPAANAATFEPKVKEVCARAPTEGWVVNRSAFVARLIQKHAGVSAIDLRPDGEPVTYDMQAAAILNPEQFCKTNGCSPATAANWARPKWFCTSSWLPIQAPIATRATGSSDPHR